MVDVEDAAEPSPSPSIGIKVPNQGLRMPFEECLGLRRPIYVIILGGATQGLWIVDFCSIGYVLATKFGGEAAIHVFSKTQKSFLEIPPRDNLIKIINLFLMVPKSKLRKTN